MQKFFLIKYNIYRHSKIINFRYFHKNGIILCNKQTLKKGAVRLLSLLYKKMHIDNYEF